MTMQGPAKTQEEVNLLGNDVGSVGFHVHTWTQPVGTGDTQITDLTAEDLSLTQPRFVSQDSASTLGVRAEPPTC